MRQSSSLPHLPRKVVSTSMNQLSSAKAGGSPMLVQRMNIASNVQFSALSRPIATTKTTSWTIQLTWTMWSVLSLMMRRTLKIQPRFPKRICWLNQQRPAWQRHRSPRASEFMQTFRIRWFHRFAGQGTLDSLSTVLQKLPG